MKKVPARILSTSARIVFSIPAVFLVIPSVAYAAAPPSCPPDQAMTEIGCLSTDPIQFVSSFYGIGLGLIGGVSLLFIIVGGYNILTSRGNPEQVNVGKNYIFYSILGLLLAIFGYLFIEIFLVDILHLPGFSH